MIFPPVRVFTLISFIFSSSAVVQLDRTHGDIDEITMNSLSIFNIFLSSMAFFDCVFASSHGDFYGRRYDHYHGKYSDSELMVDVLNNFGLRILMVHNEHNENNIAFSPYGIGVILMALGEGLRGEALYEIRKAIYLPYDAHTIRVGLRDIHRHLKSYFIPKEGFLAGITLNIENVSINPEYIQLLKFYGYDINSFNTALYPEKHVTTTESGAMGGREETTITTDTVSFLTTVNSETTTEGERTTSENPASTTEPIEKVDQSTTTTENLATISTIVNTENSVFLSTTAVTEATTFTSTTQSNIDFTETTTPDTGTTESLGTTAISASSTMPTTTDEVIYSTTENEPSSVAEPQTTTTEGGITIETTEPVESSSIFSSTEETTQFFTSVVNTSPSNFETTMSTINSDDTESTTTIVRNIRSSEESLNPTDDESEKQESYKDGNKENMEVDRKFEEFGLEDWRIQINNQLTLLNPNEEPPFAPTSETIINKERRIPRSIEEYVITRFYHYNNFRPTKPYEPDEPLYFFVNEKNKEAGLDFMTYDTVLPFLYLPNPSAMALAFPLDSDKYYLLLMVPSENSRLDDLICKLYMHNTFKYIVNNLELTHVRVNIPSFSLNGRITLTNALQKLGIRRIFEPRQADFSPMTRTDDVYVTNIEQAISVTIKNNLNIKKDTRHGHRYYSEPIRFDVNRPFLYFVVDSELQIILMTGKVVNPLNIRIK